MTRTVAESTDCTSDGVSFTILELTDPEAVNPVSVVFDKVRISPAGQAFLGLLATARKKRRRSE